MCIIVVLGLGFTFLLCVSASCMNHVCYFVCICFFHVHCSFLNLIVVQITVFFCIESYSVRCSEEIRAQKMNSKFEKLCCFVLLVLTALLFVSAVRFCYVCIKCSLNNVKSYYFVT